jgi:hypothetical protein
MGKGEAWPHDMNVAIECAIFRQASGESRSSRASKLVLRTR